MLGDFDQVTVGVPAREIIGPILAFTHENIIIQGSTTGLLLKAWKKWPLSKR